MILLLGACLVLGLRAGAQGADKAPVPATESWWSDTLGLLAPAGTVQLPGERLYKARWLIQAGAR